MVEMIVYWDVGCLSYKETGGLKGRRVIVQVLFVLPVGGKPKTDL